MLNFKHNYHTHTVHCKHASLSVEDVINYSKKIGLETIGFSEHAYNPFIDEPSSILMDTLEDTQKFINEVNHAKAKHKGEIEILCGFECDIIDQNNNILIDHINFLSSLPGVDYIIIGHHHYFDNEHVFTSKATKVKLKKYVEILDECLSKTKVSYIAHPDAFVEGNGGFDEICVWGSKEIIKVALKHDIPLGININGLAHNKKYPSLDFMKIAASMGASAIIELDAHSERTFDSKWLHEVNKMIKQSKIKIINKLEIPLL